MRQSLSPTASHFSSGLKAMALAAEGIESSRGIEAKSGGLKSAISPRSEIAARADCFGDQATAIGAGSCSKDKVSSLSRLALWIRRFDAG